jgi:hypothetical protein
VWCYDARIQKWAVGIIALRNLSNAFFKYKYPQGHAKAYLKGTVLLRLMCNVLVGSLVMLRTDAKHNVVAISI